MPGFKIAHIREQGQDMVIVPLEPAFGRQSDDEQAGIIRELQWCSADAGLAGRVVVVWRDGSGFKFIAPPEWHAFFRSLSWSQIMASINRELSCS